MAAPTPLDLEVLAISATTPRTTGALSVVAGQPLVAWATAEDQSLAVAISDSQGLTWTLKQSVDPGGNFTRTRIWTAIAASTGTLTVTFTGGASRKFSAGVRSFDDSDGIGTGTAKANGSGAPSVNITTGADNSAVVVANGDWNAVDGSTRTWRTNAGALTEDQYLRDASAMTIYAGYHADAGAAGTYAVGLSAPAGQAYSVVCVEVLGSASSGSPLTAERALSYDIANALSASRALSYDVQGAVSAERALSYDVANSVVATRALSYDLLAFLAATRALSYDVLNALAATRALSYDVLEAGTPLSATRALSYDVLNALSAERALSYDVLNSVVAERALSYDLLNALTAERTLSYDVLVALAATRALSYDVANTLAASRSLYYNLGDVETPAGVTRQGLWYW